MKSLFAAFLLLSFTACSTNLFRSRSSCINPEEIKALQSKAERNVDTAADAEKQPPGESQLVVDQCFVKVFSRRGYRWSIIANPDDKYLGDSVRFWKEKPKEVDGAVCLNRLVSTIDALNVSAFSKILHDYRERFKDIWDNPDLGPLQTLSCPKSDTEAMEDYPDTIGWMNEQLTRGPCYKLPPNSDPVCFFWSTPETYAPDIYHGIDPSRFSGEEAKTIAQWQEFVFIGTRSPYILISAILRRSLAYEVSMALNEKHFIKRNLSTDAHAVLLPLYMDLLYKYLENLKIKFPEMFAYNGAETKDSIVAVTNYVEQVYAKWSQLLKNEGISPSPAATQLWSEYKDSKAKAGF
jgi:hypothetical protein